MRNQKGQILIHVLILTAVGGIFIAVISSLALQTLESIGRGFAGEQSIQIAEAGVEYYRWHLAHDPQDFQNGTEVPGPYIIPFYDKDNVQIGDIVLDIEVLGESESAVRITSTGILTEDPSAQRTIEVILAKPSLARFAVVANDAINFGPGTEVFGPIHSNGGIRFDGYAHNLITSAQSQYNDPDHSGQDEFGVHTHVDPLDPLPPASVPDRPDVFLAGRDFPVPAIDFEGITADLATIKTEAQASGLYFGASGVFGYEAVVKIDDTIDIYKVNSLIPKPSGCSSEIADSDWGIWSIQTSTIVGNYLIPENGLVFFEDDVWVRGKINTEQVTIAAARFPENPARLKSITVNNDLLYTNYDGQDTIGLIAQGDINVGLYSEDNLRIDAAIIAKSGRVGRYYYRAQEEPQNFCGDEAFRDTIQLYGMLVTNERYGFSWTCSGTYCSGYANRILTFDGNLKLNPPPGFPLTAQEFEVVLWQEK